MLSCLVFKFSVFTCKTKATKFLVEWAVGELFPVDRPANYETVIGQGDGRYQNSFRRDK